MTNAKIENVKTHLKKHKEAYIAGGVCLIAGAAVGVLAVARINPNAEVVSGIRQIGGHHNTATIITFVERSTPSKPVWIPAKKEYFDSINDAARKTGHSLTQISKNANGLIPDINGDVFEFVDLAS